MLSRLPQADVNYFLDVDPETAGKRLDLRILDPRNEVETQAALNLLYAGLIDAANQFPLTRINGRLSEDAVFEFVMEDLRSREIYRLGQSDR